MRTPRIHVCHLAICAALAATSAHAVHISPNGTGQVLIFPHYTVRNGFSTLISIDNTHNNTKAVKVRFRESMNGRDVFDFNLYLSPNDTWTGAVVETTDGARMVTNDNSCVSPADLFTESRTDSLGLALNAFKPYHYTGGRKDAESLSSLDRTREGFFEVIEMGTIDPGASPTASQIVVYVKQNAAGIPADCRAMDAFDGFQGNPAAIRFPNVGASLMSPPTGGLRGRASLIGAATGANYSFSPTALDAWSSRVAYSAAGNSTGARLSDAFPAMSTVATHYGVVIATWVNGQDAVSAALMRDTMTNEFVLDSGTRSQTDWIVTFPTKPFYPDSDVFQQPTPPALPPFANSFSPEGTGACDAYAYLLANREALAFNGLPSGAPVPLLPPRPVEAFSRICWTANIIPFSYPTEAPLAASLLASRALARLSTDLRTPVVTSTTSPGSATTPILRSGNQGPNGKLTLRFDRPQQQLTPTSAVFVSPSGTLTNITGRHYGLPVIGVMLHNYQNTNVVSNYGGVVEHSYSVRVE